MTDMTGEDLKTLRVRGMFFSGTGTTRKVVGRIASSLARALQKQDGPQSDPAAKTVPATRTERAEDIDFTPPGARGEVYRFDSRDIVVFGVPVIAGRVPNVLLPFLNTIEGGGAAAIPIVLYGNRDFDDALIELRNILEDRGFCTVAAAAFIGEHSFSRVLAAGRPDDEDLAVADAFAESAARKLRGMAAAADEGFAQSEGAVWRGEGPVSVDGQEPLRPYYKPRDRKGNHINILKVKPKLDESKCDRCGICVSVCPMGSIKADNPGVVDGICIKCCGCEKMCPQGALYFDDPGYLYHKEELELGYPERKEPKLFL